MNFDPRPYCERLAKADPERFEFIEFRQADVYGRDWLLIDRSTHYSARGNTTAQEQWAFIGPLADELGLEVISRTCLISRERYSCLLEATFAVVCDSLEDGRS